MNSNKSVLWDVDGTLSNSYMLGFVSTLDVLRTNNLSGISEDTYHQGTKYTTPHRLAWHATGDINDSIGIRLGKEFDELYIDKVSITTAPFYNGIGELLSYLRDQHSNLKYGAVSNANSRYVHAVLKVNQASHLFDIGLGADEVAAGKPHPEGLLRCSSFMDIPPQRCIYVGDSPTDGQAAAAAGMLSVGVTWGSYSAAEVEPHFTHTVHSVEELREKLDSLLNSIV